MSSTGLCVSAALALGLAAAPAHAEPAFLEAEGLGASLGRTADGEVEGAAVAHIQTFGHPAASGPLTTYGSSGASLGAGNAGLSLEGKGDAGLLIRTDTAAFPALGLNVGLGMRADTARDQLSLPGRSDDWVQAQVEVGGGFGVQVGECGAVALARIGAAAGGEGTRGHGLRYGPSAQLDCPGFDLAINASRTDKAHDDGRPIDRVDTGTLELAFTVDEREGLAFGIRAEAVTVNAWSSLPAVVSASTPVDTRTFFVIELVPHRDDDDEPDEPQDQPDEA